MCLGARLLLQSYQYPNLSVGTDCFGGQLRGDKECPFSGVTKSDRVWRKVPVSDARSVRHTMLAYKTLSNSTNIYLGRRTHRHSDSTLLWRRVAGGGHKSDHRVKKR